MGNIYLMAFCSVNKLLYRWYIIQASSYILYSFKKNKWCTCISYDFSTLLRKRTSQCVFILSKSILQPSDKNTHKANHWVYNPSISYDGKQMRPQGAISSGANKIFIREPMLISLKGWELIFQEKTVISRNTCNSVNQFIKLTIIISLCILCCTGKGPKGRGIY